MGNTNLMNMNRQELQQLRFTVEGQVCTTSCEMLDGKESCLQKNKEGALMRGFCREILDQDSIRKNLGDKMKVVTDLTNEVQTELNEQVKLIEIENTNQDTNFLKYNEYVNKNDQVNNTILNVNVLEKRIQKMKITQTNLNQSNLQKTLKLNKQIEELKVHGNEQECNASKGYDVFPIGNGLLGSQYDNVYFEGTPSSRVERQIKLMFIDSPIKGVNPYNFSLRLEGFIRAPVSGYYTFSGDSDDGVLIKINGDPILRDRFLEMNFKDWLEQLKTNIEEGISKSNQVEFVRSQKESQNGDNKKSKEIFMNADEMQHIEIFYRHSVHNSNKQVSDQGKLNIFWESKGVMPKTILNREFLYDSFVRQNLKLNNFNFEEFERVYLQNNQKAFKDSPVNQIVDVPIQLHGALFLRSNMKFNMKSINFTVTSECIVYLVIPREDASIIPEQFIDEGYEISLMTVRMDDLNRYDNKTTQQVFTREERPLKVYRYNQPMGKVDIPLSFDTIIPDSHMMVFVDFDLVNYNPLSCGGQIMRLTDSSIQNADGVPIQNKCVGSTNKDNEHLCAAAFSNDGNSEGWVTDPKKADGDDFLELYLNQMVWPTSIQIYQTGIEQKKVLKIRLDQNDDNQEMIELDSSINQPEFMTIQLKKVVSTNKLRFTLVDTSKPDLEHMLLVNVFGTLCTSISTFTNKTSKSTKLDRLQGTNFRKPVYLNCIDNLNSLNNYNIQRGEDMSIWISCSSGCIKQEKSVVIGLGPFAENSSICKVARYKGIIGANGGSFKLQIQQGLKEQEKGETANGIDSLVGKSTRKSFVVKKYEDSNIMVVTPMVGMEVEVQSDGKWKEGSIKEIVSDSQIKYALKLDPSVEGEAQWPPDKKLIALCGTFIHGLICNDASSNSIKVNFGPDGNKFNGQQQDSGEKLTDHDGIVYGWSQDMRKWTRKVADTEDPSPLNTYVKFNSDPMSKFCNTTTKSKQLCEKVNWVIKVPNRMQIVKVTLGDLEGQSVQNIQANGTSIVSHVLTNKKVHTNMAQVGVKNHQIMLESTCHPLTKNQKVENIPNCNTAWTGLMTVEIIPVYPDAIKALKNSQKKVCNKDLTVGGRCMDKDPSNCLQNDPYDLGTHLCVVPDQKLIQMPRTDCKESSLKYKCVKLKFNSEEQCLKDCPFTCKDNSCVEE